MASIPNTAISAVASGSNPLTFSLTIGSGAARTVVVTDLLDAARTYTAITFNGAAMTEVAGASIIHSSTTPIQYMWYYDVPDALAAGDYTISIDRSAGTTDGQAYAWQLLGVVAGGPEDADEVEGASGGSATQTRTLTCTDGAVIVAAACNNDPATTFTWSGDSGITERAEGTEANYTTTVADCVVSGAGAKVINAVHSGTSGRKLLTAMSFAAVVGPTVTSVDVEEGTAAGGTAVTITGTGFDDTGGASEGVTFGGTAATSVIFVNSTTITCVTPAHAAGLVDVVVTNGDATSDTLTDGFLFGDVAITQPGLTNGAGAASGTLTSTLYALSGLAKRAILTTTMDGVTLAQKRGIKLTAPA